MKINKEKFYTAHRQAYGSIYKNSTVDNINTMLTAFETHSALFTIGVELQQAAYIAATVKHESAGTYGAFKEIRQQLLDTPSRRRVRALQDRYWNTGYYGRGPVQLTWEYNYSAMQKLTGAPLLNDPDLLLRNLGLGYEVTLRGILGGVFTGKKLEDYINNTKVNYVSARKTVNVLDKAGLIAEYAEKFYNILKASVVLP